MIKTDLLTAGKVFPVALSLFLQVLTLIFHGEVYSQERPEAAEPKGLEINLLTNPSDAFGYTDIYDPSTETWTPAGSLNMPRTFGE